MKSEVKRILEKKKVKSMMEQFKGRQSDSRVQVCVDLGSAASQGRLAEKGREPTTAVHASVVMATRRFSTEERGL